MNGVEQKLARRKVKTGTQFLFSTMQQNAKKIDKAVLFLPVSEQLFFSGKVINHSFLEDMR